MYPLDVNSIRSLPRHRWSAIGPNVYFLGLTSMLTDISSEMVTSILPLYLVFALGLTPLQFGFIDGLAQGAAAIARLASGWLADRWKRNREVAAAGYGLSALCKLLLIGAGSAWYLLSSAIALDRIGKGIRTAPRDALISLSSAPQRLGLAFGVHRAFDTAGALLGPLAAFAILAALPQAFELIFVSSFFIAIVGVAALLCFVRNVPPVAGAMPARAAGPSSTISLLRNRPFRWVVLAGSALGLVTVGDSFIFLLLQRKMSTEAASFPLFYVATASIYLALAIPSGWLADRIGRRKVFLLGHLLLALACINLLVSGSRLSSGLLSLGLLGAYYACTDGVLTAAASALLPVELRATGLALLATGIGLSRLLASVLFGALWNWFSIEAAMMAFTTALVVMLMLTLIMLRSRSGLEAMR